MSAHHFLAWVLSTPWALRPETMSAYAAVLARRHALRQGVAALDGVEVVASPQAAARRAGNARSGGIAVVPVVGTIVQRASQLDLCEGGTTTQAVSQALREANADESIAAILLDIDSPGGSVYGVAELAAEVRASAKPVTAVANSLAASAAYWIGSAASEFYVTPGGEVGSIGVWMAHEDWSRALEAAGVNTTIIQAGKYKTEGHPFGPLPDEARAFLQTRTDDYYAAFTRDVAKGRRVSVEQVRAGMGEGRVLGAAQAVEQKMVDGVMAFDQVITHMQRALRAQPTGRAAADQRRVELELAALR